MPMPKGRSKSAQIAYARTHAIIHKLRIACVIARVVIVHAMFPRFNCTRTLAARLDAASLANRSRPDLLADNQVHFGGEA